MRVEKGDDNAVKEALWSLLLCPWEGPRVKIMNSSEEDRLEKGERLYKEFVIRNREWLDVNLQANLIKGDSDSLRVAGNQIHHKSMRNLNKKEYDEDANTRKYVEALLGTNSRWKEDNMDGKEDSEWTVVERKRRKGRKAGATILVAKIPSKAKSRDLWSYFGRAVRVMDIILPRKKDRRNNKIGFVKVQSEQEAIRAVEVLAHMKFEGVRMDIMLAGKNEKKGGDTPIKENLDSKDRPLERSESRTHEAMSSKQSTRDGYSVEPPKKEKGASKDEDKANTHNLVPVQEDSILDTGNCLIGFSAFSLRGEILQEVLLEMEEDLIPKRRVMIEVRGLPFQFWSDENLEKMTQKYGLWGWWCNRRDSQVKIENPLIWIYSDCLEKIEAKI
ncbi:hypothetical protein ACET3Z_013551 [Daucus carota]